MTPGASKRACTNAANDAGRAQHGRRPPVCACFAERQKHWRQARIEEVSGRHRDVSRETSRAARIAALVRIAAPVRRGVSRETFDVCARFTWAKPARHVRVSRETSQVGTGAASRSDQNIVRSQAPLDRHEAPSPAGYVRSAFSLPCCIRIPSRTLTRPDVTSLPAPSRPFRPTCSLTHPPFSPERQSTTPIPRMPRTKNRVFHVKHPVPFRPLLACVSSRLPHRRASHTRRLAGRAKPPRSCPLQSARSTRSPPPR